MKPITCTDFLFQSEDIDTILEGIEEPSISPDVRDLVMNIMAELPSTLLEALSWLDGALALAGEETVCEEAVLFIIDRLPDTGSVPHIVGSQENYL